MFAYLGPATPAVDEHLDVLGFRTLVWTADGGIRGAMRAPPRCAIPGWRSMSPWQVGFEIGLRSPMLPLVAGPCPPLAQRRHRADVVGGNARPPSVRMCARPH